MNPNDSPTGYMLYKNGVERGPYSLEQLDQLRRQNAITAFDFIRQATSETWTEAFQILKTPSAMGECPNRTLPAMEPSKRTLHGSENAGNMVAGFASFILPGLGQLLQGRLFSSVLCLSAEAIIWYVTWDGILTLLGLGGGWGNGWCFVLTLIYHLAAAHDAATYKPR